MTTIIKQRILLALVADLTRPLLLVRDDITHDAFAKAFPLLEAAHILVARGSVDDLALAVHLVRQPFALVHVAVLVRHGAKPGSVRGHHVAGVRVAVHVGRDAGPVGAAALERAGEVVAGEVGLRDVAVDSVGVVRAEAEIVQVVGRVGKVSALLDEFGPVDVSSVSRVKKAISYSSALGLFCKIMTDPDVSPSSSNVLYDSIILALSSPTSFQIVNVDALEILGSARSGRTFSMAFFTLSVSLTAKPHIAVKHCRSVS